MNVDLDNARSVMTYSFPITGTIISDGTLTPAAWQFEMQCTGLPPDIDEFITDGISRSFLTYSKIVFFIEQILNNSIFVDFNDDQSLSIAISTRNNVVYLPSLGNEYIIQCLHNKISKIAESKLLVGRISILPHGSQLKFTHMALSNTPDDYDLPDITYFGEKSAHQVPWWVRNDAMTYDVPEIESEDLSAGNVKHVSITPIDQLALFEKDFIKQYTTISDTSGAQIIPIPKRKIKKDDTNK